MQSYLDRAQVQGIEQINDSVYYDSSSEADDDDEDDDNTFQDVIQVEDVIDDTKDDDATIYGETINNGFMAPVGAEGRATGVMIEHEWILHSKYYYYGELYCKSCEIYVGDDPTKTKEAIDRMAHSSKVWSLCDNVPPFQVNPMLCLRSKMEYDQQVIERNQQLTYQGLLDNCKDAGIAIAELQEAQTPLKPSIRRPEKEDWERMRKYFGNVPANTV